MISGVSVPDGVPPGKNKTPSEARRLALIDCFAKGTWIALGLALLCLSIDGYAMFELPHHQTTSFGDGTHGVTVFAVSLWTLEVVLALLSVWLVRFAFSRPPRFLQQP